jgi:hypothetical protein
VNPNGVHEIIVRKDDVKQTYGQSHPKHLTPKLFWLVVFPTGIKNRGQHKEKQHLSYTPQHPFQLEGMLAKGYTDDDERK